MMGLPQVKGVGILEVPESFTQRHAFPFRSASVLRCTHARFRCAILWTGASSLDQVCLTTYAAAPYPYY